MAKVKELKIRPLSNPSQERTDWCNQAQVIVNLDVVADLRLKSGGRCRIAVKHAPTTSREAVVVFAKEKLSKTVIQMSRAFQKLLQVKIGDVVLVTSPAGGLDVPLAESIILQDVTPLAGTTLPPLTSTDCDAVVALLEKSCDVGLAAAEILVPGMNFTVSPAELGERVLKVAFLNGREDSVARFHNLVSQTRFIENEEPCPRAIKLEVPPLIAQEEAIFDLNLMLQKYGSRCDFSTNRKQSCGLVIDGPLGCGREDVVASILATGWGAKFDISAGETAFSIREKFAQARENQPSIVLIKNFKTENIAVINAIAEALDILSMDVPKLGHLPRCLVLLTCTDYVSNVPPELRAGRRFPDAITLRVPTLEGRRAVIKDMGLKMHSDEAEEIVDKIVHHTFGWTEGDLTRLAGMAERIAMRKYARMPNAPKEKYHSWEDFFYALQLVRPMSMEGIDQRPPKVLWDDIGGHHELKKSLAHAVRLMTHPNPLVEAPRGILLYGPPGCSKTMAAQAMATAARCNFFSVKGGELLNMYVGESERNVRILFERARRAAPSIIFFDEMDGIGGARGGMGDGSRSNSTAVGAAGSSGVKIIQALLTEIDGFESYSGVMIVGATNKPENMDAALLRPGRIDKMFYVGPPKEEGRHAILEKLIEKKRNMVTDDLVEQIPEYVRMMRGFSGADITQAWKTALFNVTREMMDGHSADDDNVVDYRLVDSKDLMNAIEETDRTITPDMIEAFEAWRERFKR